MKILCIEYKSQSAATLNFFFKDKAEIFHNYVVDDTSPKIDLREYNPYAVYINESSLLEKYDIVFVFIDPIKLVDKQMYNKWRVDNNGQMNYIVNSSTFENNREIVKKYCDVVHKVKYEKLVMIDTDDRARYKDEAFSWIERECGLKFDLVLKKEYRRNYEYSYKNQNIVSFPYLTHSPKHIKEFYLNRIKPEKVYSRFNKCIWGGSASMLMDLGMADEWINRKWMIESLSKIDRDFYIGPYVERDQYLKTLEKYKMCLHLNGHGQICHRFWEGLYAGCLMIVQEMDIVFPFEFHPLCVFEHPDEYLEKTNILKTDLRKYEEAYNHQDKIIDQYFSREYISNLVMENL